MVSIVLGVGALGAALAGGGAAGAGFYFWKKTAEPNRYDASLHIDYNAIFARDLTEEQQAASLCWTKCEEGFLDDNPAVSVAAFGDFGKGKTFVLNGLSGMKLETDPEQPIRGLKFKNAGWVAADKRAMGALLVDTEGLNHLPEDACNRELMMKRQAYDPFIQEMAVRIADVPILVTDRPSISTVQKMRDVCSLMERWKSARTLVIVYNMPQTENKDDLSKFFDREVVSRLGCSKFENTMPQVSYHYHNETFSEAKFTIVHLPLAKEGSDAGKAFNKNTFESIRYLCEVEAARKEDSGERRIRLKEQLVGMLPLFRRVLGVTSLPKDESQSMYIPFRLPAAPIEVEPPK